MRIHKAALLAFVSIAMLSMTAYAEGDGRKGDRGPRGGPGFGMPGMPGPEMIVGRMAERLGLDDVQREFVRNIMDAARPELQALHEKARANRDALATLDAGSAEVQNIAISNGELATEATLLFARVRSEINAVLTEEQRAELAVLKESRQDRREDRRGDRQERREKQG